MREPGKLEPVSSPAGASRVTSTPAVFDGRFVWLVGHFGVEQPCSCSTR